MKNKLFILFIMCFINFLVYSGSAVIEKIQPIKEIKGSSYFPLFIGEKWVYDLSFNDNKSKMTWEIVSYNIINDLSNDLKNVYGFEVTLGAELGNLYFIEYDGFICSYNQSENGYTITRLFPINPQLDDRWSISGDNYNVTLIDDEKVKVEYENEKDGRFGYRIFKKNIGFYENFETSKKNEGKNILKYILSEFTEYSKIDFSKYNIVVENKVEDLSKIEIKKENTTEENKKNFSNSDEKNIKSTKEENFNILELLKDRIYIQISSFNSSINAVKYSLSLKSNGYNTKIFQDKDGYYKVLIDTTSDEKVFLEKIRKEIEKGAFVKQRIKK